MWEKQEARLRPAKEIKSDQSYIAASWRQRRRREKKKQLMIMQERIDGRESVEILLIKIGVRICLPGTKKSGNSLAVSIPF